MNVTNVYVGLSNYNSPYRVANDQISVKIVYRPQNYA